MIAWLKRLFGLLAPRCPYCGAPLVRVWHGYYEEQSRVVCSNKWCVSNDPKNYQ